MKRLLLWSLVLCTTGVFAQNFQGKAYYQSKTTMDMDSWGGRGRELSAEQKKRIQERMKSFLEKVYILDFNQSASTFKEEDKIEAPGSRGGGFGRMMMGSFSPGKQYKDVRKGIMLEEKEFFGKKFLIKDSLPALEWKMEGETKQIGKYLCFKATALKKVDDMDFSAMRPKRNNDKEKTAEEKKKDSIKAANDPFSQVDIPKEILVTAWYTLDIPINQGPSDFWGLPGLILEVNAYRTTILCSKIVMNPGEKEIIEEPTKGKVVTRKEYNEIVKNKMLEMREMYRGRGRGGRRGRG